MALPPYLRRLVSDVYDPIRTIDNYFGHAYDQNFGLGLLNDDLLRYRPSVSVLVPLDTGYFRPVRHLQPEDSGVSTISNKADQLQISLEVQQFKPEEISVKVANGYLIVEGKHEEKQDQHGFVSRQFSRRYKLPETVKLEEIKSSVSSDGILSITAPKKIVAKEPTKERVISIVQTGQPALKATEKKTEEKMET